MRERKAERLLVGYLDDMRRKLESRRWYDVVSAAAHVDMLLTEGIADLANKRHRVEVRYRVVGGNTDLSEWSPHARSLTFFQHEIDPERSLTGGKVRTVDGDQLLKTQCLVFDGEPYTVRNVVDLCRNAEGGLGHFDASVDSLMETAEERGKEHRKGLAQLNRMIQVGGVEPTMRTMVSVCRITLRGLAPLERAIQGDA